MITLLYRGLMYLVSAGLGLLAADLLLDGFQIQWDQWWGFVVCIVVFAVLQSVLSPWVSRLADRYAPVLMGGIGIFSTLIALMVVVLLPIGSVLLPLIFLRRRMEGRTGRRSGRRAARQME